MPPLRHRSRRLVAVLTALVVPATLAVVAADVTPASAKWRPPQQVRGPITDYLSGVRLATNARGDSVAVFIAPKVIGGVKRSVLQVVRRPAGGRWTVPTVVVTPPGATQGVTDADVAIAANGRALVAWSYGDSQTVAGQLDVRTVPVVGGFGPIRTIAPLTSDRVEDIDVAVAPNGRAFVAWDWSDAVYGTSGTVDALQPLNRLSAPGDDLRYVSVGIAADGDADAIWERDVSSPPSQAVETCAWSRGDTGCDTPVQLSDDSADTVEGSPDLSVAPDGSALACFNAQADPQTQQALWARRPAHGVWRTPGRLSPPGAVTDYEGCRVAQRPDGTAIAGFVDDGQDTWVGTSNGGGFDHWQVLDRAGDQGILALVTAGPRGHGVVTYSVSGEVRSAMIAPGGRELSRIGTILPLHTGSTPLGWIMDTGVDDQGNAYVVAMEGFCAPDGCGEQQTRVVTVMYDNAAPTVTGLVVPPSGRRGSTVTIKALGVGDRVSAFSARWRFSDGTTASGTTVRKRLTRTGTLGITLTVTDADGRSTVKKASMAVRP